RSSTIDSDYDSEFDTDDDSEYDSDKSVDYLSPDEEELIELRIRIKANREAKAKAKANSVLEMNEPNAKNSMHVDNVRGDTFKEHDIYMNDLVTRLNTTNEGEITQDLFISIEKHMKRYQMYNETTHWRLRKPKVGEKFYVCFAGLADGWKAEGRKVIALDVVNVENKDNWSWFLELLEEDIWVAAEEMGKLLCLINIRVLLKLLKMSCQMLSTCNVQDIVMRTLGKITLGFGMLYLLVKIFLRVPESYIPAWFETYLYFVAYHHFLKPVPGRPRKKQSVVNIKDVDVDVGGTVRDGSEQDGIIWPYGISAYDHMLISDVFEVAIWSKQGSAVAGGLKGGTVAGGLKGSTGASGSKQSSESASVSKRKAVSSVGTQKRQRNKKVGTSRFARCASGSFQNDGYLNSFDKDTSSLDEEEEFGFSRSEFRQSVVVGSVKYYERHVFLCYKKPSVWPPRIQAAEFDRLPRLLSAALTARKSHIKRQAAEFDRLSRLLSAALTARKTHIKRQ
nr:sucrase/ferredoxin family protein [Tanacetum cinerariifolium]